MGAPLRISAIVTLRASEPVESEPIDALPPGIRESGDGEVLTIRPHGFAAEANSAARSAGGEMLLFVNDAKPASARWLARLTGAMERAGTGAVGPRLIDAAGTEETGRLLRPDRFGPFGFTVEPMRGLGSRTECDALAPACLLTPRALFLELGGFTESFGAEFAVLDYCFRVRGHGQRVMVDAGATFERLAVDASSTTGTTDRREHDAFAARWRDAVVPRDNLWPERSANMIRRDEAFESGYLREFTFVPDTTVLVHGPAPAAPSEFRSALYRTQGSLRTIVWACEGAPPTGVETAGDELAAAQRLTERRGDGYIAFVRGDTVLGPNWLGELIDALEYAPETIAATVLPASEPLAAAMPCSADARCTLVAPRFAPQDLRLRCDLPLNDALGDWIARAVVAGRNVRRVRDAHTTAGPAEVDGGFAAIWGTPLENYRQPDPLRLAAASPPWPEALASIVMLSWNAPHFTEVAVASIREHTRMPYEIIVIDNGSEPETLERLAQLQDVRIIYNAKNTGFAYGCNQGLAAARGTHVVLLNNDVVVTAGWLEALIDIQRRNPTVGMSAPYSNHVGGIQQIAGVPYTEIADMHAYAANRCAELRGRSLRVNRAVGFCLCISRRVIDEIGGLDPRYGLGGFEDDDFCLRVRATGYEIALCADAFVHHFGEASFKANQLDASALFFRNKAFFERRWGTVVNPLAPDPKDAYDAHAIIRRGFDRATDFVPLPEPVGVSADWAGPA
jgi:GT2 family glycosyltransferase